MADRLRQYHESLKKANDERARERDSAADSRQIPDRGRGRGDEPARSGPPPVPDRSPSPPPRGTSTSRTPSPRASPRAISTTSFSRPSLSSEQTSQPLTPRDKSRGGGYDTYETPPDTPSPTAHAHLLPFGGPLSANVRPPITGSGASSSTLRNVLKRLSSSANEKPQIEDSDSDDGTGYGGKKASLGGILSPRARDDPMPHRRVHGSISGGRLSIEESGSLNWNPSINTDPPLTGLAALRAAATKSAEAKKRQAQQSISVNKNGDMPTSSTSNKTPVNDNKHDNDHVPSESARGTGDSATSTSQFTTSDTSSVTPVKSKKSTSNERDTDKPVETGGKSPIKAARAIVRKGSAILQRKGSEIAAKMGVTSSPTTDRNNEISGASNVNRDSDVSISGEHVNRVEDEGIAAAVRKGLEKTRERLSYTGASSANLPAAVEERNRRLEATAKVERRAAQLRLRAQQSFTLGNHAHPSPDMDLTLTVNAYAGGSTTRIGSRTSGGDTPTIGGVPPLSPGLSEILSETEDTRQKKRDRDLYEEARKTGQYEFVLIMAPDNRYRFAAQVMEMALDTNQDLNNDACTPLDTSTTLNSTLSPGEVSVNFREKPAGASPGVGLRRRSSTTLLGATGILARLPSSVGGSDNRLSEETALREGAKKLRDTLNRVDNLNLEEGMSPTVHFSTSEDREPRPSSQNFGGVNGARKSEVQSRKSELQFRHHQARPSVLMGGGGGGKIEMQRRKHRHLALTHEMLKKGVIVRKHRPYRTCEQIQLSSTDGCITIGWKSVATVTSSSSDNKGGGFLGFAFKSVQTYFNGTSSFRVDSIRHVIRATDLDPDNVGLFGTKTLRRSNDIPDRRRTFSVVYAVSGVSNTSNNALEEGGEVHDSLDVECDDDKTYSDLFQGFFLLLERETENLSPALETEEVADPQQSDDSDVGPGISSGGENIRPYTPPSAIHEGPTTSSNVHTRDRSNPAHVNVHVNNTHVYSKSVPAAHHEGALVSSTSASPSPSPPRGESPSPVHGRSVSLSKRQNITAWVKGWRDKGLQSPPADLDDTACLNGTLSRQQMHTNYLGDNTPGSQVWERLVHAGLEVERLYHGDQRHVMLRVRLSNTKAEAMAEERKKKIKSRERYDRSGIAGEASGQTCDLFKSSESQKLIDHIIRSSISEGGAELDDHTMPGRAISCRLPLHNREQLDYLFKVWVLYWQPLGGYEPMLEERSLWGKTKKFMSTSKRIARGCFSQPLLLVAGYFGESIAFYFAWMGFYTRCLVVPSIVGTLFFSAQVRAGRLDLPIGPLYSFFIMFWASSVLVLWRQRCTELAFTWGVLGFEAEELVRPQFKGTLKPDSLGEMRLVYPSWKRMLKYIITVPFMVIFTGGVLTAIVAVLVSRQQMTAEEQGSLTGDLPLNDAHAWYALMLQPSVVGLCIPILYQICKVLSAIISNFENHRTESRYRSAMILKVFSFRFVTVFASMYYYGLYSTNKDNNWTMARLQSSLLSFMTVGQWWYMVWMTYVPHRIQKRRLARLKAAVKRAEYELNYGFKESPEAAADPSVQQKRAWKEKLLEEASSPLWEEAELFDYDIFDDYTMSMIQFGYVTFFSLAFPLAPLLALLNNLVQMRVDAFKLCKTRRRPIAQKTKGIGVWDNVLEIMTLVAVVTNCALIGRVSSIVWQLAPDMSSSYKVLAVVVVEHMLLFLKYSVEASVPRVPEKVERALLREHRQLRDESSRTATSTSRNGRRNRPDPGPRIKMSGGSGVSGKTFSGSIDAGNIDKEHAVGSTDTTYGNQLSERFPGTPKGQPEKPQDNVDYSPSKGPVGVRRRRRRKVTETSTGGVRSWADHRSDDNMNNEGNNSDSSCAGVGTSRAVRKNSSKDVPGSSSEEEKKVPEKPPASARVKPRRNKPTGLVLGPEAADLFLDSTDEDA